MSDTASLQVQYNSLQQMYATLVSDISTLFNAYPPNYADEPSLQFQKGIIPLEQSVAGFAQLCETYYPKL